MSLSVLAASGCAAELAADAAVSACVAPAGDVLTSSCAVADSGRKPAPVAAIPVVSSAAIRFNFMTSSQMFWLRHGICAARRHALASIVGCELHATAALRGEDRKSTRLNSSH